MLMRTMNGFVLVSLMEWGMVGFQGVLCNNLKYMSMNIHVGLQLVMQCSYGQQGTITGTK